MSIMLYAVILPKSDKFYIRVGISIINDALSIIKLRVIA